MSFSLPGRAIRAVAVSLLVVLAGCTRFEDVEQALGTGIVVVLPFDEPQAFDTVRSAIRDERLELEAEDSASGILWVRKGLNWWDWGERIVIRVRSLDAGHTEVEIVARASLRFLQAEDDTIRRLQSRVAGDRRVAP